MKRIYHHHESWEIYKLGMYKDIPISNREDLLQKAVSLLKNEQLLYDTMKEVLEKMPISCEHFMTKPSVNKQAFLGQSACLLCHGVTDEITKEAWGS